ncbi:hypothetical protein G6F46_014676 [Rhizopus delemar]|nr:hypothetical protein G6F46_014676 [Rhizopus delemar]
MPVRHEVGADRPEPDRARHGRTAARALQWAHADRPVHHCPQRRAGAHGRRHRQALPPAVQTAGRGPGRLGNDHQRPALLEHAQVDPPHGP